MSVTPLSFRFIAARLDGAGLLVRAPDVDVTIRGITDDSRHVSNGDLFCAWTGTSSDSHTYLAAVQAAGGAAALVEHSVESVTLPQIVVRDGRRAAAVAAAALHGEPQEDLILAGVTGTNGKTTTVWILRHLLSGWYRTASLGTLGIRTDAETGPSSADSLTTPGPVELSRTLRALVDDGFEALAMEVSSHSLHQGRVEALRFDVTVFTNLTRDH